MFLEIARVRFVLIEKVNRIGTNIRTLVCLFDEKLGEFVVLIRSYLGRGINGHVSNILKRREDGRVALQELLHSRQLSPVHRVGVVTRLRRFRVEMIRNDDSEVLKVAGLTKVLARFVKLGADPSKIPGVRLFDRQDKLGGRLFCNGGGSCCC